MRHLIFALALLPALRVSAAPAPISLTTTVKAGDMLVAKADFIMTDKKTYAHLLWDAFPYRAQLKGKDQAKVFNEIIGDLVKGPLASKYPKADRVKIDIVEFTERDNYGLPKWDSVKKLEKKQALKNKDGSWKLGKDLFK